MSLAFDTALARYAEERRGAMEVVMGADIDADDSPVAAAQHALLDRAIPKTAAAEMRRLNAFMTALHSTSGCVRFA